MKKRFVRPVALCMTVLTLLVALSGCYFLPKEEEVLEPPLKEPEAVTYKTHTVEKGTVERFITGTGKLESTETEVLYYQSLNGRLKTIHVKSGDTVKAGDLIVELDVGDLENTIYRQEKAVRQAELSLEIASRTTQPDAVAVKKAQINYNLGQRKLNAAKTALNGMTDEAQKAAQQETIYELQQNLELLKLALQETSTPVKPDAAAVERAQIAYDLEKAQLEIYRKQLDTSRLYASMDGLVTFVAKAEPGDQISAYTDLVRIADSESLRVSMVTSDYSELSIGMAMEISFDVNKKNIYKGKIVQLPSPVDIVGEEKDESVKIEMEALPEDAKIGDSANVNVLLERKEDVVVLPLRYVSTYSSRRYVRVLNEEGIPEERDVKLGVQGLNTVEIVSGLEAGEVIVI